ncbi:phosphoglycerate mutase [Diplodia corticola]|uniref:Phosphoglycerate mutase n=1 Tax=Diplodia corticola TaxID=236234 RepID=A0A1J9QS71_9PEZI|nr:phosphoglycerate mutase [Diplodia corticola]OJD30834.1 phosphoglycerate mutase [Diplodia corticola]
MPNSPILFFTTVLLALVFSMGEATQPYDVSSSNTSHINYTTVTGYFLQDDPATDPSTFDYTKLNLGLINRTYPSDDTFPSPSPSSPSTTQATPSTPPTQWQRFAHHVSQLNRHAAPTVRYKVLVMGRHGEGDHNVAEAFYGTPAWDCHWSLRDGNGTSVWADARLTPAGVAQARVAHAFWAGALGAGGDEGSARIPAPERYYVSPLARCLATAEHTFGGLEEGGLLPPGRPFRPVVKELLRESLGLHTCDRRSSRTWIAENYPGWEIEEGFAEEDELWSATLRESSTAQIARLKTFLDDIFTHDPDSTFISLTSHSGSIRSLLKAVGHRDFSLLTGAVIPVLIRAETLLGPAPPTTIDPPTTAPTCTVDPTAAAGSGAV